jgi:hypothetical protein
MNTKGGTWSMATINALPPTLRGKLTAVARHLRFLRAVRGLSLVLLVLAVTAELALLADAALGLPAGIREGLLAGWVGLGLGLTLFGLIVPVCRRIDPEDLAALIEEKYPELGERLTSTVELADAADIHHGSRTLIDLLMRDTEARTLGMNFLRAVPAGSIATLAVAAAVMVLLAFAPALAWPGPYGDLGRRFLLPWRVPPTVPPYALEVTPGTVFAAKDRPLAFTVHVVPQKDKVVLPATATLVMTDSAGNAHRWPMVVERQDEFSLKLDRVPGDFRYHVEAGAVVGGDFQVNAVEPVELADRPTITITPPEYARPTIPEQKLSGIQDFSALQYSRVRFDFHFTRPAQSATLTWTSAAGKGEKGEAAVVRPLDLNEDHSGGTFDLLAGGNGTYRLVLTAEHDITTEIDPRTLTVQLDQPPAFTKVVVPDDVKFVLPYDRVPLEITAADDVGVAAAAVEYKVGDAEPAEEAIKLDGAGTQEASARHLFDLSGKGKTGDVIRYRLRVADNRLVPEHGLTPHVIYHPENNRWLMLRIASQATPVKEQEILAQRDAIDRKLDAIAADLRKEDRGVYKVRQESRNAPEMTPEQRRQTKELRTENRGIEAALRDVSREAEAAPALAKIAEGARDVADQQMRRSDDAVHSAEKEAKAPERDTDFVKADEQLTTALERVQEMRRQNDKLAQERLDQMKLEMTAEREKQLAEQAAELAAKDPVKQPDAAKEAEELRRQQQEVANQLEQLAQQSDALREALDAARAEQAKQLAERARELAKEQRELAQAEQNTDPKRQAELSELARKQQELAEKAQRLAQETKQAAQTAKANPLKPEEAQRAAEALKQGDASEAVQHQDQAARDLEQLARDLDRAVDVAKDPREAAKQLARLEEGLRKQLDQEAPKRDAQRLETLRRDQAAVARAAEQLSLPSQNQPAQQARREAAKHADQAAEALKKQDPRQAGSEMEQARQSLQRLADTLPTLEQRQAEARAEVARLRQQQAQTSRVAEQAVKQAEKQDPNSDKTRAQLAQQLGEAARRQAETAERLSKLDAPNQEARQQRTQETLNQALADLMDARPQDVAASQAAAQRELERLEQALSGQKPNDERARILADRQQRLAEEAARAAADPKTPPQKLEALRQEQSGIAVETRALKAPEAPQRHAEAMDATHQAEQAAQAKPADADTAKRMEEAARALDRLARQMAGQESEAARAERLARRQAEAAAEAEQTAKEKPNEGTTPRDLARQRQLAEEAKQVRAGDEGQAEKQKAMEALDKAKQPGRAEEQAKAERKAAEALRELADKLAGRTNPAAKAPEPAGQPQEHTAAKPDDSPRGTARELARKQNELAKATHEAQKQADAQPGPQSKQAQQQALEQLGKQQQRLNEQASQLPANQAQKQLEQAREAMNQARQALAKNDAGQAYQKQREAANQLDNLANRLPERPQPTQARNAGEGNQAPPAQGMPNRQQGEQARELAREQRELRDAVQKMNQAQTAAAETANPLGDLVKQQRQIAEQSRDLAQNVAKEEGGRSEATQHARQAAQAAQQTSNRVQNGALERAQESGKEAAQQLRQLAQQLSQTPRPAAGDPHAADPVLQARDLAKQQEDVNRRLQDQAGRQAQQAQQREQQRDLARQAGEMAQDLNRLAQQMNRSPQAQQSARQAANSGQQAEGQMQRAQNQGRQGNQGQRQQAQQEAAQSLERAADRAEQAGRQMAASQQREPGNGPPQAGQAVQQAQGQMQQAQQQLGQGQPKGAQGAMQQAAQALQQAAQQLAQQQQQGQQTPRSTDPGPRGAAAGGTVDASMLPADQRQYAGKRWGELPGELQTRIIQDMKAKYGEDYARIIKLYFEQIADTKKK